MMRTAVRKVIVIDKRVYLLCKYQQYCMEVAHGISSENKVALSKRIVQFHFQALMRERKTKS